VYPVIADPPFELGALNEIVAVVLPGTPLIPLGAPGTVVEDEVPTLPRLPHPAKARTVQPSKIRAGASFSKNFEQVIHHLQTTLQTSIW